MRVLSTTSPSSSAKTAASLKKGQAEVSWPFSTGGPEYRPWWCAHYSEYHRGFLFLLCCSGLVTGGTGPPSRLQSSLARQRG
eukprot:1084536-Amphidinium_carterae.1